MALRKVKYIKQVNSIRSALKYSLWILIQFTVKCLHRQNINQHCYVDN